MEPKFYVMMSQDSKVCAFIYNKKKHVDLSLESSLPPSIWIWKGTLHIIKGIVVIFSETFFIHPSMDSIIQGRKP
jgi:hypothetical protein